MPARVRPAPQGKPAGSGPQRSPTSETFATQGTGDRPMAAAGTRRGVGPPPLSRPAVDAIRSADGRGRPPPGRGPPRGHLARWLTERRRQPSIEVPTFARHSPKGLTAPATVAGPGQPAPCRRPTTLGKRGSPTAGQSRRPTPFGKRGSPAAGQPRRPTPLDKRRSPAASQSHVRSPFRDRGPAQLAPPHSPPLRSPRVRAVRQDHHRPMQSSRPRPPSLPPGTRGAPHRPRQPRERPQHRDRHRRAGPRTPRRAPRGPRRSVPVTARPRLRMSRRRR